MDPLSSSVNLGGGARKRQRVLIMVQAEQAVGRRILEGIADYADHHGRWQHFLELQPHPEAIRQGGVDGMIVAEDYHTTRQPLWETTIPAIRVAGPPSDDGPPWVAVDNRAVGQMGANYLADLGLKHLVFVPQSRAPFSEHREEGFLAACQARGLWARVLDVDQALSPHRLQAAIAALPEPVGIMAVNDRVALNVARACRVAGRAIPEQVALLGVDNEAEICRLADPPFSSIDHGARRIGYEAAWLLDHWLSTGVRPRQSITIAPVGVVARPSTDLLAIDDPDVVAAIRFIRSHYGKAIKVKDVLRHVAMSRRTLEVHFRAALGRSIHSEILRVRMERAKALLANSGWTMPHIAEECGFSLASQFSYVFKRETGQTPQAFRNLFRYNSHASA
jgi:LacI family transcriptional regulator